MNLITAQRDSQMPIETRELIAARSPVLVHVNFDGHEQDSRGNYVIKRKDVGMPDFWCEYGEVHGAWSKQHRRGNQRPCIHTMKEPAPCQFIGIQWAHQLNWQPTIYVTATSTPVIASRVGDIVTLAFDQTGPIEGCSGVVRPLRDVNRWHYRLFPMRFDDENAVHESALLGVWAD